MTARFEGINLGDGMAAVQQADGRSATCRPRSACSTAAPFEEQQKSFKDLAFVLVLAIVLVFMVLLFEFGNFAAPLADLARRCFPPAACFWRC